MYRLLEICLVVWHICRNLGLAFQLRAREQNTNCSRQAPYRPVSMAASLSRSTRAMPGLGCSGAGKKPSFDAIVANPPFSLRWEPTEAMGDDVRFKNYGLAPKSAADFAFLLHGFHYLKDEGVMAIILPHGVLFRGGAEERIRTKLLKDSHIDTVIGLPANLFYSTGIPVCILVLKKCKKPDDVLFINAAEHFAKGKRQNQLTEEHIGKIIDTYQFRKEEDR